MSTHLIEKVGKIEQILTQLTEESSKGKPIVVEGKKDTLALQELGIFGVIVMAKTGGKSFLEVTMEIEKLGIREVILFLDFDRRGREGTKHLQQNLERVKIKVNVKFWRELHCLVGREVQCIESLPYYLTTIQQKIYSQNYSNIQRDRLGTNKTRYNRKKNKKGHTYGGRRYTCSCPFETCKSTLFFEVQHLEAGPTAEIARIFWNDAFAPNTSLAASLVNFISR